LQANWQEDEKMSFDNLNLTANGSTIAGNASVILGDRADWNLNLHATTLDLDSLLTHGSPATDLVPASRGKVSRGIAPGDCRQRYPGRLH
jgi:AsmA protein